MLRNLLERPCQIRVAKHLAHFRGAVIGKIGLGRRLIGAQVIHFARPIRRGPFRNRKPILGGSNRRRQIFRQLFPSKFIRQFLPAVHGSRYGNGIHSLLRHAPDSQLLQVLDRQTLWRPPAGIDSIKLVRLRVINNRKQIPADAIHHRFNNAHHRVRRNRCVHGVPAALQYSSPRLRRQRRFRRHNPIPRNHHRPPLRAILSVSALRCHNHGDAKVHVNSCFG